MHGGSSIAFPAAPAIAVESTIHAVMKFLELRPVRDLVILITGSLVVLLASLWFDPFSRWVAWIYRHDNWKLDELFTLTLTLMVGLVWYSWRRWNELAEKERQRQHAEANTIALARMLDNTLTQLRTMEGLLRICESCKRIRDDSGYWIPLEAYVESCSGARFFQGLCPDCARKFYRSGAPDAERADQ
jgi:hypothetical protein